MNAFNLKRTNLNFLLVKQIRAFLSSIEEAGIEPKSILVIGFSVCKETPTKLVVKHLVKYYRKRGLSPPDFVVGDCNASVNHMIAHSAVDWGVKTVVRHQSIVAKPYRKRSFPFGRFEKNQGKR